MSKIREIIDLKEICKHEYENYQKIFLVVVEHDDGMLDEIRFGWRNTQSIDSNPLIIIANWQYILLEDSEEIDNRIYKFCSTYKKDIMENKDILEIVSNDPYNILNFFPYYTICNEEDKKENIVVKIKKKILKKN